MTQNECERACLRALDNEQFEKAGIYALLAIASAIFEKDPTGSPSASESPSLSPSSSESPSASESNSESPSPS